MLACVPIKVIEVLAIWLYYNENVRCGWESGHVVACKSIPHATAYLLSQIEKTPTKIIHTLLIEQINIIHTLNYYHTSICFFRFPHDDVSALITTLDLEQSWHWNDNLKFSSQLSILKNFPDVIRKDFDQFVDLTREKLANLSVSVSLVIGVELVDVSRHVTDSASISSVLALLFPLVFTSIAGSWKFVQISTFSRYFVILGMLTTHEPIIVLSFLADTVTNACSMRHDRLGRRNTLLLLSCCKPSRAHDVVLCTSLVRYAFTPRLIFNYSPSRIFYLLIIIYNVAEVSRKYSEWKLSTLLFIA